MSGLAWSGVEKAELRVMVRNGRTVNEIGLALERSASSIRYGIWNYGPGTDRSKFCHAHGQYGDCDKCAAAARGEG